MLEIKNIHKTFFKGTINEKQALIDVSLKLEDGDFVTVIGGNGAGKSTIIKSIVGIQTISGGAITVCGYDVQTQPVEAKTQIGFVPDHYALYEKLKQDLKKEGLFDFDDMIQEAVRILKTDKGFCLTLSERYQFIMLDEFQDTNSIQYELLTLLAGKDSHVHFVNYTTGDITRRLAEYKAIEEKALALADDIPESDVGATLVGCDQG